MSNYPEYIERNALIERIKKAYCDGCENYNGVRCRTCDIDDAIDVVEDAPTVERKWRTRMANTLWHPASELPRERTQPLLLATKTTWRDKDGKMLQGFSPTAYFLGCYADGQFWDEIGERLPKDVTVTHWMAFPMV